MITIIINVFLDNCSSDDTIQQIYLEFASYDFTIFPLDQTVPLYQARNIAISHVKTKYCAFLDVDDLWHPFKFSNRRH